jgi:hypothetical protein
MKLSLSLFGTVRDENPGIPDDLEAAGASPGKRLAKRFLREIGALNLVRSGLKR